MTLLELAILLELHKSKVVIGTKEFARRLNTEPKRIKTYALMLANYGMIGMKIGNGNNGQPTIYEDRGVIRAERPE